MTQGLSRMLAPLARRIRLIAARAVLLVVEDASKLQGLQVRLLAGEVRDSVERFQNYGFTAHPHPGAEGVYLSLNGSRDHGVIICMDDRRYRLKSLKEGEVAIYDDLGQKVHLTREGIRVDGANLPITIQNTPMLTIKASMSVRLETPLLAVTGEIKDHCDMPDGKTMSVMRTVYDEHDHHENNSSDGNTNKPNQRMST